MKLQEFLPDIANRDAKLVQANSFLNNVYEQGFSSFAKSHGRGIESTVSPLGIEQLY